MTGDEQVTEQLAALTLDEISAGFGPLDVRLRATRRAARRRRLVLGAGVGVVAASAAIYTAFVATSDENGASHRPLANSTSHRSRHSGRSDGLSPGGTGPLGCSGVPPIVSIAHAPAEPPDPTNGGSNAPVLPPYIPVVTVHAGDVLSVLVKSPSRASLSKLQLVLGREGLSPGVGPGVASAGDSVQNPANQVLSRSFDAVSLRRGVVSMPTGGVPPGRYGLFNVVTYSGAGCASDADAQESGQIGTVNVG